METFTLILAIVCLVFGILQIILFFKVWNMTNNVAGIKALYEKQNSEMLALLKTIAVGNEGTQAAQQQREQR